MPEIDLICFSHVRWDAPAAEPRIRPMLDRAGRTRRVFLVEDPVYDDARPHLTFRRASDGVMIAVPTLPRATGPRRGNTMQRELLNHLLAFHGIRGHALWFWNPAALGFADHLAASAIVYDCSDEPPPRRTVPLDPEHLMFGAADVVVVSNATAFQAKRAVHPNVHVLASPDPEDAAGWARAWAAAERLIDRAIDARQVPLAAAK